MTTSEQPHEEQAPATFDAGSIVGRLDLSHAPDEQDVELARWFVAKFGGGWVPNPNGLGGLLGVPADNDETDVPAVLPAGWRDAGVVDDTSEGNGMRYRKKPVEIEAVQWTGDNFRELDRFTVGMFRTVEPEDRGDDPGITAEVFDKLHSTWVGVKDGQWVICGVQGEFYPCDPDVLSQTYERADAPAAANLGCASTRELLAELAARIEVDGANGGGGLDYRTVDGRDGTPRERFHREMDRLHGVAPGADR